ncbi:MAG: beta-galactosidase [Provencibacterium sp.]|jgi:beta-galactosidase/beta-glucuronidase|nr:beta-galactosidase [Provencibacterium sp.]
MNQKLPRPEHPRPQMERGDWENLNGSWEFAFDFSASGKERRMFCEGTFDRTITVPFCPESALSGIGYKDFMPAVWYRRQIVLSEQQLSGRVLLHFGAVDYEAEVWVNGESVGVHRGGFSSFTFDITRAARAGENTIVVCALDDVRSGRQPSGKQSARYHHYECFYTRTTGIWQTVWLEFVPKTYIRSYRLIPDPANGQAHFEVCLGGEPHCDELTLTASFEGRPAGSVTVKTCGRSAAVSLPLSETHLWEPGAPALYDLTLSLASGDRVRSYFGLRTIEWRDKAMYLNGKIVFQRLILDQGFFPDGIYTASSDEALRRDIELSMALGFNGARMHEKIFEERYLYWADKLGYLVWGEMANWGLDITTAAGLENFLPEWVEAMERDFNHAALIGWCPFNETWDWRQTGARQDDSVLSAVYQVTKALDPTRPVIDTSGNFHVVTDIYDIHWYEQEPERFRAAFAEAFQKGSVVDNHSDRQRYDGQPYFVSEYGGTWWNPKDASRENWGYGMRPDSEEEVLRRYVGLTSALMERPEICAFCYTQLTDVEQEQNGLYTYTREKKFSDETYRKIRETNLAVAAIERRNA